jgi:hypothetical protein
MTNDPEGDFQTLGNGRFAEPASRIAEIVETVSGGHGVGTEFISDINQRLTITKPLDRSDGKFSLRIVTASFSYRTERWPPEKLERFLEGGFLILDGGPTHKWLTKNAEQLKLPLFWHSYGLSNSFETAHAFTKIMKEHFPDIDMSYDAWVERNRQGPR